MATYSLEESPKEVQELVSLARKGGIAPHDFCKELARLGVEGPMKMFYLRDAFRLPLKEAKRLAIEFDHGSVEAWAEEILPAIDELSSESEDPKEPL
jgi:hypothetical protein